MPSAPSDEGSRRELHVRRERADGNRARFFPRAVKADNREILCWAVVVRHAGPRIGGAS